MADMYGAVCSNWFKVKNQEKFKPWFDENCFFGDEIELWVGAADTCGFGGYEQYPTAYPRTPRNEELEVTEWDLDTFGQALAEHLQENEKVVVVAAGNEKLRYVAATRLEVRSDGACRFEDWYAGN